MKQAPQLLIIKSNLDYVFADKLGVVTAKCGHVRGGLVDSPRYPCDLLSVSPIGWIHKPIRLHKRRHN
jgi:hypothetical protein